MITKMEELEPLKEKLTQELRKLPLTSRGVYRKFLRENLKGYRGKPAMCPFAIWVNKIINSEKFNVSVGEATVTISDINYNGLWTELTSGVRKFIVKFDKGKYPKLVINE